MELILSHTNADFDAVASLLAAYKLNPKAVPVLPERLNRNVADFITLYQSGLPFVRWEDFRARKIERVILVDTQRAPGLRGIKPSTPTYIIDHHPLKRDPQPHLTVQCELLGATTTLLVEHIQQQGIPLNSLEATLLALGIYEDTGSLAYKTTTPRDIRAAAWLVEQNAALDTVRRFLTPPLTDEQQTLLEALLAAAEHRHIQGHTITVVTTSVDGPIAEISSVAHRLRDMLDSAALFVLVQMPDHIQMVCRSRSEAIDVGEIARYFGGGGHDRAAAATIRDRSLAETVYLLWEQLHQNVKPVARVADLMSFGVQTVNPDSRISEIIQQMRRIGHEGYPVVEAGRVIGLLTRREADRAVEHGLGDLSVREIMSSGEITLTPDDSVSTLEQTLVESGWGQIPVADDKGQLIGIVTRTDLIKHWARTHPAMPTPQRIVPAHQIERVMGRAAAALIDSIAQHAQKLNLNLYLVGGAVRDLLLYRQNLDIDFVVEGDAIRLARSLSERLGGRVGSHGPFGTAKWVLDADVARALGVELSALPNHVDFATSRNEFYEHPTALPTVYNSSIKLDLQRRDFTINTIAIQLSPAAFMGRILDFYGGLHDLENRLIRVLHSLSFVDDPTRILRAVRFEQRLGFTIEPRTSVLIATALPMLRRITGERVRNELTLLLREDQPERGLLRLQAQGVTEAIHPAFVISEQITGFFERIRAHQAPWPPAEPPDIADLYWHALACTIPPEHLPGLSERLKFGQAFSKSFIEAAQLYHQRDGLGSPLTRPSQVVQRLNGVSESALLTTWILSNDDLVRERIQRYMLEWRHVQPAANGHTLRALGLKPGPAYRLILDRLRVARLDGEVNSDEEERMMLRRLIEQEISPDDRS